MKRLSVLFFLGVAATAHAMGRGPDVGERTVYETPRARGGSPANPNSAYAPPRFDESEPVAPEASSEAPEQERSRARSAASRRDGTRTPSTQNMPVVTPAAPTEPPALSPSPKLPVDASEPPLPEQQIEGLNTSPTLR